jgi:hypothetical protein
LRGGRLKMPFVWEAIKVWRRELRRSIAAIFPPAWQGQSGTPFFPSLQSPLIFAMRRAWPTLL